MTDTIKNPAYRALVEAFATRPNKQPSSVITERDFLHILERITPVIAADARRQALEEAAKTAEWSHMVPPDGGSPTEDECQVASEAGRHIRALIDTPGPDQLATLAEGGCCLRITQRSPRP